MPQIANNNLLKMQVRVVLVKIVNNCKITQEIQNYILLLPLVFGHTKSRRSKSPFESDLRFFVPNAILALCSYMNKGKLKRIKSSAGLDFAGDGRE